MSIKDQVKEAFAEMQGQGSLGEAAQAFNGEGYSVVDVNKKGGIGMGNLMERINSKVGNVGATVSIEGKDYAVKTMPILAGDFRGYDENEATARTNSFVRTMEKGLAWYENLSTNASMPNNIPINGSCPVYSTGFVPVDLSKLQRGVNYNDAIGLYAVRTVNNKGEAIEPCALRFLPPYEDETKMFAILEVNLPVVCNGKLAFIGEDELAYTSYQFPVYDTRKNGILRPFVQGILKTSSQKYLGKIQATNKDGVGLTRQQDGKDVPVLVSHYAETLYQSFSLPINYLVYAQIMLFVKERIEARVNAILGR
jgi:hypothetical protein